MPQQSGFSGCVQPGLGYLNMQSNMVAKAVSFDLWDKSISDLDDEPDSESTAIFTLPFKIAYPFVGSRTKLFLGTEVRDLLSFIDSGTLIMSALPFSVEDILDNMSDGAFEIHDAGNRQLGLDGMLDILKRLDYPQNPLSMPVLEKELLTFSNEIRLQDDVTIIEVSFLGRK